MPVVLRLNYLHFFGVVPILDGLTSFREAAVLYELAGDLKSTLHSMLHEFVANPLEHHAPYNTFPSSPSILDIRSSWMSREEHLEMRTRDRSNNTAPHSFSTPTTTVTIADNT